VDVVGSVPGQVLVGADGVVLEAVGLGGGGQVEGVRDLLEEEPLAFQGAEAAFA
jgi:hypothetical protein